MRKPMNAVLVLPLLVLLNGCEKDEMPRSNPFDVNGQNGNGTYAYPQLADGSVNNIYANGATYEGEVIGEGGSTVIERGLCYNYSGNPSVAYNRVSAGGGAGRYTCALSGLVPGFTYYLRAYAINAKGVSYGNVISFSTPL